MAELIRHRNTSIGFNQGEISDRDWRVCRSCTTIGLVVAGFARKTLEIKLQDLIPGLFSRKTGKPLCKERPLSEFSGKIPQFRAKYPFS